MLIKIIVLACIGLLLSLYSYNLEQKIKQDQTYKPACDISDHISCSKPITSPYGALLGVPNSLLGILFYAVILILALLNMKQAIFLASLVACGTSLILAFILLFKIKALCLICLSIYVVNGLLLWASMR